MCNDGFENTERNILFASATTSYAYRNLLMPLTYNVGGIDEGFIYTDTDSHFLTIDYWNTIKEHVDLDKYRLGAWDLEHKYIKNMTVLNHKKYCLLNDKNKIEVYSGGVPKDAFNTDMPYDDFVQTQFCDGVEIENLKNTYTRDQVICLYKANTKLSVGTVGTYANEYSDSSDIGAMVAEIKCQEDYYQDGLDEDLDNEALYYDTIFGTFGASDISQKAYNGIKSKYPIDELIKIENEVFDEIN